MTEHTRTGPARPPKVNLRAPGVAWPTLSLFLACLVTWSGCFALVARDDLAPGWGMLINFVVAFVAFTPMHDAAHRSVARAEWVNQVIGRCCAYMFLAPFTAFRYVHLEHHKHTNDEHKDPDLWSGRKPTWLLPFRWLSQDIHYYYVYFGTWKQRPVGERYETLGTVLILWSAVIALCLYGYAIPVLLLWVVPSRLALVCLAYGFDYLPHKPHEITSDEDRYRATLVRPNPLLTPVLIYQNYHLIHHLYPGVPFYRYAEIWRKQKDFLLAQGVEVRSLTGKTIGGTGAYRAHSSTTTHVGDTPPSPST